MVFFNKYSQICKALIDWDMKKEKYEQKDRLYISISRVPQSEQKISLFSDHTFFSLRDNPIIS